MAGNLIKVDEFEISSNVGSVILGGGSNGSSGLNASIDSTFDVYVVRFTNLKCNYDTSNTYLRVTTSGTADTSNNYDRAHTVLWSANTIVDVYTQNGSYWGYNQNGTGTGESQNGIMYLFDFASSSEYSFYTLESTEKIASGALQGIGGGGVHTVGQACDGLQFYTSDGNYTSGSFVLYGIKK